MCAHNDCVPLVLSTFGWEVSPDDPTRAQYANEPPTRREWLIDRCIAPIVAALDAAGVYMLGSCCGHGNGPGEITLADGRRLFVASDLDVPVLQAFHNARWPNRRFEKR